MRSLRRTLLASILAGVSVAVLIAGIAVYLVARSNLRSQLDTLLLDRANTLASLVIEENGALEFEYDQPLSEANVGVLVRITDDDGRVVAQSPAWPSAGPVPMLTPEGRPVLKDIALDDEESGRLLALAKHVAREPGSPGEAIGRSHRTIVIEVIERTRRVQQAQSAVLAALVVGGVFAILGSILAVWLGVRRGLAPVRALGGAVDDVDTDQLRLPARPDDYPEELRPIVAALEGLLDRLRAAIERERRFTDAAAHELRTPLAALKTITDVADRWPEPERLHRGVKDARTVVRQMEDLLECLLAAARGSAAEGAQVVETVALLPLARAASESATARLEQREIAWSFEGGDATSWSGPKAIIAAIVRNLVDNAAEYTPDGGVVRIRTVANGESTAFEVENGPTTLAPSEVERIFEPFWRADSSRSDRNHKGLGLAIVDSLSDALRLEREAAITSDGCLRVRLVSRRHADNT